MSDNSVILVPAAATGAVCGAVVGAIIGHTVVGAVVGAIALPAGLLIYASRLSSPPTESKSTGAGATRGSISDQLSPKRSP
jgi:hypothetical protein